MQKYIVDSERYKVKQCVRRKLDDISSQRFYMTTCNPCAAASVDVSGNDEKDIGRKLIPDMLL